MFPPIFTRKMDSTEFERTTAESSYALEAVRKSDGDRYGRPLILTNYAADIFIKINQTISSVSGLS